MLRLAVVAPVLLAALLLATPAVLAQGPAPTAQPPDEPTGQPQPNGPDEPEPGEPPEPGVEPPGTGVEGALPRTGLEALRIAAFGILLLLSGARLRVLAGVRQVRDRVRRRLSSQARLRESLEQLRADAAELGPPEVEPAVSRVEPTTPTARRVAGRSRG